MIVARQFIAWNISIEKPSRRVRSDPYPRLINRPDRSTPIGPNHTVPYGTVPVFARIPGNKLPGYDRSVPPGKNQHKRVEKKFTRAQTNQNHVNSESLTQRWANVQYSEHAHESPLGDFAKSLLLAKNSPG